MALQAEVLPPDNLRAGDSIEYYTLVLGFGDPRGHRIARILAVASLADEYPLRLDSQELVPRTMMIKRVCRERKDRLALLPQWRKLRTFSLDTGTVEGETRSDRLNSSLRVIVESTTARVFAAAARQRGSTTQSAAPPSQVIDLTGEDSTDDELARPPPSTEARPARPAAGTVRSSHFVVLDSESSDEDFERIPARVRWRAPQPAAPVTQAMEPVPQYADPLTQHVDPLTLHATLQAPDVDPLWPPDIARITRNRNPSNLTFAYENLGLCECFTECDRGTCWNSISKAFCLSDNCAVGSGSSNRLQPSMSVVLTHTTHGLGVMAVQFIEEGAIVDEYLGVLTTSVRRASRSAYAMELLKASASNRTVFIDASDCGSIARYINHSCSPNCEFVELKHKTAVRVAVVALRLLLPGQVLTVCYSTDNLGFPCTCGSSTCMYGTVTN